MRTTNTHLAAFSKTAIAIALLAALSPTHAQEPNLMQPTSSITAGFAAVSGDSRDRAQFSIFNGYREHDAYFLFDVDYRTRNDAAGLWTRIEGRNLGLDNRELNSGQEKEGD